MSRKRLATLLLLTIAPTLALAETVTRVMEFESECLDLDAGLLAPCPPSLDGADGWDILIGYHADRSTKSVALQNARASVEIAHLDGALFEDVTAADADVAEFTANLVDRPFDGGQVILIRTDEGALFKLGRPVEGETGLQFDSEAL